MQNKIVDEEFCFDLSCSFNIYTGSFIPANKFHTLRVLFHMKRLSSHYIVMTYIPCIFVVALSCLIFWMPVTSLAERAFYGAFLFLATVLLVVSSQYGSPQVGYLKAIDIWGICCLAFVFCAVLEVMVLHLLRRGAMDNGDNRLDQFELMVCRTIMFTSCKELRARIETYELHVDCY